MSSLSPDLAERRFLTFAPRTHPRCWRGSTARYQVLRAGNRNQQNNKLSTARSKALVSEIRVSAREATQKRSRAVAHTHTCAGQLVNWKIEILAPKLLRSLQL